MFVELGKVLFRLQIGRGAETFVVFDLPAFAVLIGVAPLFVLGDREERARGFAARRFDNGRDKLLEKAVDLEQRRPQLVNHVDHEAFDVRAVVILIGHDHEMAVAQTRRARVLLTLLQPEDLDDVVDLFVGTQLRQTRLAHIQQFTFQRKTTIT